MTMTEGLHSVGRSEWWRALAEGREYAPVNLHGDYFELTGRVVRAVVASSPHACGALAGIACVQDAIEPAFRILETGISEAACRKSARKARR